MGVVLISSNTIEQSLLTSNVEAASLATVDTSIQNCLVYLSTVVRLTASSSLAYLVTQYSRGNMNVFGFALRAAPLVAKLKNFPPDLVDFLRCLSSTIRIVHIFILLIRLQLQLNRKENLHSHADTTINALQ